MKPAGYKGFGSFMSANVGQLIAATKNPMYVPPRLPFYSVPQEAKDDFSLDLNSFTFINHGAFGGALRCSDHRAQSWRIHAEKQPLRFFDRLLFPHLVEASNRLGKFLNADISNLAIIQNATSGLDAVISSYSNQTILYFNIAYGSVKIMIKRHSDKNNLEIDVPAKLTVASICELLKQQLDLLPRGTIALAVVDHVTSNSAFKLPITEITHLLHEYQIPVLVDGAHGPLNCEVDLKSSPVDYYVGNTHKWLSSSKSVGFLHINQTVHQSIVHPRITSHSFQKSFPENFYFDGCRDYCAALALPTVLDFWDDYGGVEKARKFNYALNESAADFLLGEWGSSEERVNEEFRSSMSCVPLPISFGHDSESAYFLQNELYSRFSIECPVKCINNRLNVRISTHIYNTMDDYVILARAIKDLERSRIH